MSPFKAHITWQEIREIITEWIQYGDDPFEDNYASILEEYEKTTDEEQKKILKEVLALMDVLRKACHF